MLELNTSTNTSVMHRISICTLQHWCQAIGGNQHRDKHAPKRGGNTLKHDQTMCRSRGREHSKAGVGGEEQSSPTHAPATPAECSDVKFKKKENALSNIWRMHALKYEGLL